MNCQPLKLRDTCLSKILTHEQGVFFSYIEKMFNILNIKFNFLNLGHLYLAKFLVVVQYFVLNVASLCHPCVYISEHYPLLSHHLGTH